MQHQVAIHQVYGVQMRAVIGAKRFPTVLQVRRCLGQKQVAEHKDDGKEL